MTSDLDVYRAAKLVIDQHCKDAPGIALQRAMQLLDEGDVEGAAAWRAVKLGDQRRMLFYRFSHSRSSSRKTFGRTSKGGHATFEATMLESTPTHKRISIEHAGKVHLGSFTIERGIVTVTYGSRRRSIQLGTTTAPVLAKIVLHELVKSRAAQTQLRRRGRAL